MKYAVKWEWNRHCDQSAGQKAKSVTPISSLSPLSSYVRDQEHLDKQEELDFTQNP